ncbi:MAG TPA: DUF2076 domain-containing protein [Stellaceae bacterium]|nr:DUF2076 domain-containing protein [Stellaceae bacterium]
MTPQERDLIVSLFSRLQQAANQPTDRDAEALIGQCVAQQPDAPYLLVQTVLIQDMAMGEAHNRITELERQLAEAKTAQPPPSFLGAARGSVPSAGPWGRPTAPAPGPGPAWSPVGAAPAPAAPPAAPTMAPLAMPGASSGFLRQAATTAAGIAGGALLFQGISSLFGPHYGGMLSGVQLQPGLGETVINNYYDSPAPSAPETEQADWSQGSSDQDFAQAQDVSDQDYSTDDGGSGDDGGSIDV